MDTGGSPPAQQVSGTVVFDEGGDELPDELPPAPRGGEGDEATPALAGAAAAQNPMAGGVQVPAHHNPEDDADRMEAAGETADPAVAADSAVSPVGQQQGAADADPAASGELPPELPQSPSPAPQESEPAPEPETAQGAVEGARLPSAPEPELESTRPAAETMSEADIGGMSVSSQGAAHSGMSGDAPATHRPRNLPSRGGIVSAGNDGLNLPGSAAMAATAQRNSLYPANPSSKMFHVERWIKNEGQFLAAGAPPDDQGARHSLSMPRSSLPGGAKSFGFSLESSTQRRVVAQEASWRERAIDEDPENPVAQETALVTADGVPTKDHLSLALRAAAGTGGGGAGGAEAGLVDVVATNGGGDNDTGSAKEANTLPQDAVSVKNATERTSSANVVANGETNDEALDGKTTPRRGISMKLLSKVLLLNRNTTQELKKKKGSGILKRRDRKDAVFQKVKHRRKVHFQIQTTAKMGGAGALHLLAYAVNPTVNASAISIHVMMLTYESWAIPFRLALMDRWHWIDLSMDAVALVCLMHAMMVAVSSDHERARNMRRSGITLFSDSHDEDETADGGGHAGAKVNVSSYLEAIGAKTPEKDKKHQERKKKKQKKRDSTLGEPLYAELTVAQLKQLPYALTVCASLYASEIFRVSAPEYALMVFYLSALVRCGRMVELWNFFRKKEMDLHTNMRRVALLKFFIMVFGLAHVTGCLSYFFARLSKFTGKDLNVTWVAQYKEYNPDYDFNFNDHLTLRESAKVYLLIVYTGFNGLTNMGYEMTDPQRWEEMIYCIAVVAMQIVLEAFILGTLFHYIVKKDQAVENYRKRLVRAARAVAIEASLRLTASFSPLLCSHALKTLKFFLL